MARLDEICSLNMGQSPDSSSYNEIGDGLPFFQGNADFGTLHPTVRIWCNAPTKVARPGDILISVRAPIGALNIADRECCIGRGLAAITADETLCNSRYLWYAIANKVDELNSKGTGSTFKAISKNVLGGTEIPLPSLGQQQRVFSVLDKLTGLISLRKQQIAKLDELFKARFVEMFGDPKDNPNEYSKKQLKETCNVITGNTPSRAVKWYYGDFIEWIKTDNIVSGLLHPTTAVEHLSEKGMSVSRTVEKDSILMACIAGSISSIGRICITDRKIAFNQQINAIVPNEYNIFFLYVMLQLSKEYLVEEINMSLKGILSKSKLEEKTFIVPPMELQEQFAAFVVQTDKLKLTIQQSLDRLEVLKKSLMQEYFG